MRYRFGELATAAERLSSSPALSAEEARCTDLLGQALKDLTYEEQVEVRGRFRRFGARLRENTEAARGEPRYDPISLLDVYWENLPRDPSWPLFSQTPL